jgi:SAM-dependent methyltransferase
MHNWGKIFNSHNFYYSIKSKQLIKKKIKENPFNYSFQLMNVIHSELTKKKYHRMLKYISNELNLRKTSSILDYGSGNGGLLFYYLRKFKLKEITSVEISKPLMEFQKRILNNTKFLYPKNLKKVKKYSIDNSLIISTMQYFKNYNYAKKILKNLILLTKKNILLCDVKDKSKLSTLKKNIQKRHGISRSEYLKKYKNTPILGYTKSFFKKFEDKKIKIKFLITKPFFADSNCSFDVKIEKK